MENLTEIKNRLHAVHAALAMTMHRQHMGADDHDALITRLDNARAEVAGVAMLVDTEIKAREAKPAE